MIRILFCNISYLPYYNTRLDRVAPKNGGAYVAKMHDAYEKHNFEECADGQYRGFVETKYRIGYEEGIATNTYNSLHIERIDPFAKGKTYDVRVDSKVVKRACGYLSKAVAHYLNGFPSKAYSSFKSAMNIFMDKPLKIYQKSAIEQFEDRRNHHNTDDSLKLFRVTAVGDNKP